MTALESLLKDLEEKANAATPGPWHNFRYNRQIRADSSLYPKHPDAKDWVIARYPMRTDNYPISHEEYTANAEHIATANPDTIKKLIAVIRELQQACKINWPSEDTIKQYCLTESPESALRITRFFLWLQKYVESERK